MPMDNSKRGSIRKRGSRGRGSRGRGQGGKRGGGIKTALGIGSTALGVLGALGQDDPVKAVLGSAPLILGGLGLIASDRKKKKKKKGGILAGSLQSGGRLVKLPIKARNFVKDHPKSAEQILKGFKMGHTTPKGGSFISKALGAVALVSLSAGTGALIFREYLVNNPTQIAKLGIEAGKLALGV